MAGHSRKGLPSSRRASLDEKPFSDTEFETIKMYYEQLSHRLLGNEATRTLSSELQSLLKRFESGYRYQEKLAQKLRELSYQLRAKCDDLISLKAEFKDVENSMQTRLKELLLFKRVAQEAVIEKNECHNEVVLLKEIINAKSEYELQRMILKLKFEIETQQSRHEKQTEHLSKEISARESDKIVAEENTRKEVLASKKLNEQIHELKTNVWNESQKFVRANKEIRELKKSLSATKEDNRQLSTENRVSKSTIGKLNHELKSLQESLQGTESKNDDLSHRLTSIEKKYDESERKLLRVSTENSNLLKSLQKSAESLHNLFEKYRVTLKEKMTLSTRMAKFEEILQDAENRMNAKMVNIDNLEKQVVGLQNQLTVRNNDCVALQKSRSVVEEKFSTMMKQMEALERSLQTVNSQLIASKVKHQGIVNELGEHKRQISKVDFENGVLLGKIKKLNDELRREKSQKTLLEKKIFNLTRSEEELQVKFDQGNLHSRELFRDLAKVKNILGQTEKQRDKEKMRNTEISVLLERLKDKHKQQLREAAFLRTKNTMLNDQNHLLQESGQKLTEDLQQSQFDSRVKTEIAERLMKRIRMADDSLESYRNLTSAQQRRITKLDTALSCKQQECRFLTQKVKLLDVLLKRGEDCYREKINDIKILNTEILNKNRSIECLKQKLGHYVALKQQVLVLGKQLTFEKLRANGLEQDFMQRENVHHWRIIGNEHQTELQLLMKNRILQRRVLDQARVINESAHATKEKDSLIQVLRERLNQPCTEIQQLRMDHRLSVTRLRGKVMSLRAETNMLYSSIRKHESETLTLKEELHKFKLQDRRQNRKSPDSN